MGIKRRAMFSPKFKASRPELYKKGQELRNTSPIEDNSSMVEKLKQENPEQEIDSNFTEEVVEEMIKEVEELVKEVEKPKPKATPKRTPRKTKTTTQKKTTRKPRAKKA